MKRSSLIVSAFILAASLCSFAPTAWGAIAYDTQPPVSIGIITFPVGDQLGDEVTLSAVNAKLTDVQFGVSMQNVRGTADLRLRVYDIDPVSGKPNNVLWDSNWLNGVPISGMYRMVDFEVTPNVFVPNHIALTLEQRNASALTAAVCSDGAILGSREAGVLGSDSGWSRYTYGSPLLMQVNVTEPAPEPATITLIGLGLGGLLSRRVAKRRS